MNYSIGSLTVSAKRHKIRTLAYLIVIALVIFVIYTAVHGAGTVTEYVLGTVRQGTINEVVTGTGQVAGAAQIDITPQGSGQVTSIKVKQGDMVTAGQPLMTLDQKNTSVSLMQAQAGLKSAQANYDKLVNGLTPQQLAIDQLNFQSAQQSLITSFLSAYTSTEGLIRTSTDQFFDNPGSYTPSFDINFTSGSTVVHLDINDLNLKSRLDGERAQISLLLNNWGSDVSALATSTSASGISTSTVDLQSHVALANSTLTYISGFLSDMSTAMYSLSAQDTVYQSNINQYKSTIASDLNTLNSAISSVSSSEQNYLSAEATYQQQIAPPLAEDITSSQASLEQAQASLQSAQNNYDNNIVTSPIAGQVAAIDVQVGDQAGSGTTVATVVAPQKIADISLNEVDAAKVKVGDPVTLTFDALPNLNATGTVAEVSTVGTVSQGVVDYDVKIAIASSTGTDQIESGMSVSTSIIVDSHTNVLVVPSAAIKTVGTRSFVQTISGATTAGRPITSNTAPQSIPVTVGLSDDTNTEITGGLTQGQLIVVRTINAAVTTAKTTTSSTNPFGGAARALGATGAGGGGFGGGGGGGAGRAASAAPATAAK